MADALLAVALQANEALQEQLERVVPSRLSERQFWAHYFSHVHAIKAHVAAQARARSAEMMAKNEGYLFDPQLRDTFISVIAEGVLEIVTRRPALWAPPLSSRALRL